MLDIERRARREAVRRHHPDAGGSAEALIAALQALADKRAPRRAAVRAQRTWRGRLMTLASAARRRRVRRQRIRYLDRR